MAQYPTTKHQFSLNNGATWSLCASDMDNGDGTTSIPIPEDAEIPAGELKVRVIAEGARPAGAMLSSLVAFTAEAPGETGGETPGSTVAEIAEAYHTISGRPAQELAPLVAYADALEAAGVYDKLATLRILTGGSNTAVKYNFVHPSENPGALPAQFIGTVTYEPDGVLFGASSGYMTGGVNYKRIPGAPDIGFSWYTKDLIEGSLIADGSEIVLYAYDGDGSAYNYMFGDMSGAGVPVAGGNKRGFKTVQRAGDLVQTYHGSTKVAEKTDPVDPARVQSDTSIIKLHFSYGNVPHNATVSFSVYSEHQTLTPAEQAAFYNATEALAVALGFNATP